MANFDSSEAVFRSDARQLSKIMNLDEATPDTWSDQDLAAMLRHQLAAPLGSDLSRLELSKSEEKIRDETLGKAASAQVRTFQDLFEHPRPPLALVKWAKDFFKQQAGASASRRPEQEVAYLLYLLSILIPRVRLGSRISKLSDADLRNGMKWAVSRKWLDGQTRKLCIVGQRELQAKAAD
jgi:hypothetical protein